MTFGDEEIVAFANEVAPRLKQVLIAACEDAGYTDGEPFKLTYFGVLHGLVVDAFVGIFGEQKTEAFDVFVRILREAINRDTTVEVPIDYRPDLKGRMH